MRTASASLSFTTCFVVVYSVLYLQQFIAVLQNSLSKLMSYPYATQPGAPPPPASFVMPESSESAWSKSGGPPPAQQSAPPPYYLHSSEGPAPGAYGAPPVVAYPGPKALGETDAAAGAPPAAGEQFVDTAGGYGGAYGGGAISFDATSVRNGFVRKVYAILSLQLAVTGVIVALFTFVPSIRDLGRSSPTAFFTILCACASLLKSGLLHVLV